LIDNRPPGRREFPESAIIGFIDIVGCKKIPADSAMKELEVMFGKEFARFYPKHYMPKIGFAHLWYLSGPQALVRQRKTQTRRARLWLRLGRD